LLALSLDLPLIVEFYDQPAKVHRVLGQLRKTMHLPRVISWPAHSHHACE
jgi:PII-like signaling protein